MKTKLLNTLALVAILFASCSNDNNTPDGNYGQVKFSSGVTGVTTKVGGATGNQWEGTENIGIYMVNNATTIATENAENILYTTNSTGPIATFSSETPIYYPVDATQKVDFIAYHPHKLGVSNYVYAVNTTVQTSQSAIDLMRAFVNNTGTGYSKANGSNYINLEFAHKLTKVIINTTPDTDNGVTAVSMANMTVTIKGLNVEANYNIDTNVLETSTNGASITTKTTTPGILYEAIVVPQEISDNMVTFEFALNNTKNEVFVYQVPATKFAEAEKHTFNVKIQRTGVQISGTINSWIPIGIVNGTAK